jgi:hypothetical protein
MGDFIWEIYGSQASWWWRWWWSGGIRMNFEEICRDRDRGFQLYVFVNRAANLRVAKNKGTL